MRDVISGEHLDAHLVESMSILARHSPATAVVARRDGVSVAAVGAGGPAFNTAWVTAPPADPDAAVGWAHDLLVATGRPFAVHVAAPLAAGVAPALTAYGLTLQEVLPAMVRATTRDVPPVPPGLRIARVSDPETLEAHAIAVATGFGAAHPRAAVGVLVPGLLADERVAMFNGYVDGAGEPVATSVCVLAEGVAGIYAVTVHEPARRRGVGAAMTWAAVAAGAELGATTVALQASPMGEPVYRRMGFAAVREHHRYGTDG